MNIKNFLKDHCFLFSRINNSDFEALLRDEEISIQVYKSNEIMHDSSLNGKIGIIVSGKATIKSGKDGVIIRKIIAKDVFGPASLYSPPKYSTYVIATSECQVIMLDKDFVEKCVKTNPQIAINYIEFLSNKINFLNSKINACTAKSAENKLLTYLYQLPKKENIITLPTDISNLAKLLGVSRITLYRALDKLENDGFIDRINNKCIKLKEV